MKSQLLDSERPSSYPGIWKHPAGREFHFRTPLDWLKGKRQDDDLHGLWRIHDKIYDLNTFIKHHPGGGDWLEISRGTDITEAFQVSHIANPQYVERTLEAYFVRNATTQRMSPYTFEDDGFYNVLKRKAGRIVKEVGVSPTVQIRLMMDALVLAFLLLTLLATWTDSSMLKILTGITLTMTVIAAHNFLHLKENWRRYYFDLSWLSSHEFRISHAFSHHLFPNTIMDFEISVVEPLLEFLPKREKSWLQRYGPVAYSHIVYTLFFVTSFVHRWIRICKSEQDFRPEHLIVLLHLVGCSTVAPTILSGITSWLVIHSTASYFFGLTGFNAAHHHPSIFHDGDEARVDSDFGLCQLDAVMDRVDVVIQRSLFVQLIGFGEHSLHHLFPTICQSKLNYLKKIVEETLEEFGEEFPAVSQFELFLGTLAQLRRTKRQGIEEFEEWFEFPK